MRRRASSFPRASSCRGDHSPKNEAKVSGRLSLAAAREQIKDGIKQAKQHMFKGGPRAP